MINKFSKYNQNTSVNNLLKSEILFYFLYINDTAICIPIFLE